MFKIEEVAPLIVAQMRAWESHRSQCTDEGCGACGRATAPETEPEPEENLRARWAAPALATIPEGFADATLASAWLSALVGATALGRARDMAAKPPHPKRRPRAIFVGPAGSGKTSLAISALRAALEADYAALPGVFRDGILFPATHRPPTHMYVTAFRLAKARASHPLGEGEAPLVAKALAASLLVVDELGGEDDRHGTAVREVLHERHAENLPTWVTTGVGPREIAARYDGGIARRLFEGAEVFRMGAKGGER